MPGQGGRCCERRQDSMKAVLPSHNTANEQMCSPSFTLIFYFHLTTAGHDWSIHENVRSSSKKHQAGRVRQDATRKHCGKCRIPGSWRNSCWIYLPLPFSPKARTGGTVIFRFSPGHMSIMPISRPLIICPTPSTNHCGCPSLSDRLNHKQTTAACQSTSLQINLIDYKR